MHSVRKNTLFYLFQLLDYFFKKKSRILERANRATLHTTNRLSPNSRVLRDK